MGSKIIPRVVTALVGIPLLVGIIGWGRAWHFSLLVFLVTVIALCEYFLIAFPGRRKEQALGILLGVLVSCGILIQGLSDPGWWLAGALVIACSTYLFLGGPLGERYARLGWTLVGALYIGYLVPHMVLLYRLADGREWIFFVLLVIMVGDTAGYFIGALFGRKKLFPEISPGKTVEGALGYLAASLLAGASGGNFLLPVLPWWEIVGISFVLSLLGQVGDLFESWIKRVFSVKDSSALLPGHGGLLDRIDSLIFPIVFAVYYLRLLHP